MQPSSPDRLLRSLADSLQEGGNAQRSCWKTVSQRIVAPSSDRFLGQVASLITANHQVKQSVWRKILANTKRKPSLASILTSLLQARWISAFVIVALAIRLIPSFILAPSIVASSEVLLIPTRGEVTVYVGDLWQPLTSELALKPGMLLRTQNGEASIVFHDDGVIRLDSFTTVQIEDTADRTAPTLAQNSTLKLFTGRLWVQGLTPPHVAGIRVATTYGDITVHGGSVSIEEDDTVSVAVWDRRAVVEHNDQRAVLVAGERTELWEGNVLLTKKIAGIEEAKSWPAQNLARDAVHRHEIAQLQHERRVAMAGILPTSRLYSVKRAAEEVDVFLTFSEEAKVQKKLQYAQARLNEAAALLDQDEEQHVALTLDAYRTLLSAVASGTGGDTMTTVLLEQSLDTMSSGIAAILPDHEGYVIKKAVLDARAALPDTIVGNEYIEGIVLVDGLSALLTFAQEEKVARLQPGWVELKSYLELLSIENGLDPETIKEARSLLARLNTKLQELALHGASINAQVLKEVASFVPQEAPQEIVALSEDEVMELVSTIKDRIFVYHMKRSRVNQFISELQALNGHPDQGRILRRLHLALPDGPENFPERVRREVKRLQWLKAV